MNFVSEILVKQDLLFIEMPNSLDRVMCEADLKCQLPSDFKELVSLCGSGTFGKDIVLYNPVSKSANRLSSIVLENHRQYMGENGVLELWPSLNGAITVGSTSSEFDILVRRQAIKWETIVLHFAIMEFTVLEKTVSDLLLDLFNGNTHGDSILEELRQVAWPDGERRLFIPDKRPKDFPAMTQSVASSPEPTITTGCSVEEAERRLLEEIEGEDSSANATWVE